mgnify:CR=1 FL=1
MALFSHSSLSVRARAMAFIAWALMIPSLGGSIFTIITISVTTTSITPLTHAIILFFIFGPTPVNEVKQRVTAAFIMCNPRMPALTY